MLSLQYLSSTFLALCILLSRIEINLRHGAQASSSCVPPQGSAEAQVGQAPQEVEEEVLEEGRPEEVWVTFEKSIEKLEVHVKVIWELRVSESCLIKFLILYAFRTAVWEYLEVHVNVI